MESILQTKRCTVLHEKERIDPLAKLKPAPRAPNSPGRKFINIQLITPHSLSTVDSPTVDVQRDEQKTAPATEREHRAYKTPKQSVRVVSFTPSLGKSYRPQTAREVTRATSGVTVATQGSFVSVTSKRLRSAQRPRNKLNKVLIDSPEYYMRRKAQYISLPLAFSTTRFEVVQRVRHNTSQEEYANTFHTPRPQTTHRRKVARAKSSISSENKGEEGKKYVEQRREIIEDMLRTSACEVGNNFERKMRAISSVGKWLKSGGFSKIRTANYTPRGSILEYYWRRYSE